MSESPTVEKSHNLEAAEERGARYAQWSDYMGWNFEIRKKRKGKRTYMKKLSVSQALGMIALG